MCASEIPVAFADVAAPILKLCVLYFESSSPASFNVADSKLLNEARDNGDPSSKINRGPEPLPLSARCGRKALMGHTTESVRLKHNLAPLRKGGRFGLLNCKPSNYWSHAVV